MSFHRWLQNLCSVVAPRRGQCHHRRRGLFRVATHRPHLEVLEDRCLLSFSPAGDYPAASNPHAVATADFNNDGKLDLAVATGPTGGRVSVRLGDGAGGFGTPQEFATGWPEISAITVADFNGDTKPDMVLALAGGFSILMGNGDGTFQPAVNTPIGSWGLSYVVVGNFNNDSNLDLVVAFYDADFMLGHGVCRGNGQGGFADVEHAGSMFPTLIEIDRWQSSLNGRAVATGDFTGDGRADLVVVGDSVAVLRGRSDGGFDSPIYHSANGTVHTSVATADFDADGKLDAVVANGDTGTVSMILGNSDGTLRYAGAFATGGASPQAVAVGDFNGDGRPDVAVANAGSNTMSVLLNDGNWEAVPPVPPTLSISDTSVTEGNTGTVNATFTVSLSFASAADVTVRYATATALHLPGYAVAPYDYTDTSGTVLIPAGQTSGTFTVAVVGDRLPEPAQSFVVNLSSATNAAIGDGQGVGTILDDEPRISVSDVSKSEGRRGTTTLFTFTVKLSVAYDQAVTMSFRTVSGTATTSNSDYIAKTGTLTFAPGETTKTITIEVKGDRKKEANETFYLDLFGNSGNSLFTKKRGLGTILNDD